MSAVKEIARSAFRLIRELFFNGEWDGLTRALVVVAAASALGSVWLAYGARPSAADSPGDLRYEVRAVEAVRPVMERDGFDLRFVDCRPYEGGRACAVCSTGPRNILGAALVRCDDKKCEWPAGGDWGTQGVFEEQAKFVPDDCIDDGGAY